MKNPFKTKNDTSNNEDTNKELLPQRAFYASTKKKGKTNEGYTFKKLKKAENVEKTEGAEEDKKYKNPYLGSCNVDEYTNPSFIPRKLYKRLVDKKLTIILLENTTQVAKIDVMLKKIIKTLVISGSVTIISYGEHVNKKEISNISDLINIDYICREDLGEKTCLFDALVELESLVSEKHLSIEETESERIRVNNIEIIGIGSCRDNCSSVAKKTGIDCFYKATTKQNIVTKYYCLTEESFIRAAEVGFHSIGAICRNYQ